MEKSRCNSYKTSMHLSSSVLGDQSLDLLNIGTNDSVNPLTLLEEQNGRHSGDFIFGRNVGDSVNVNLVEMILAVLLRQLLNNGSNGLARVAPGGMEVYNDQTVLGDSVLELLQRGDFSNHFSVSLVKISRSI